jgi:hypothetical protein
MHYTHMRRDLNVSRSSLHVGDLVEVRSPEEILATLDENGELESLPFMPEMLQFCGKRFRVDKIAVKACDTIAYSGLYRMHNAVHLSDVRCDGSAHGGCQAACNIYWKESWLRKVESRDGAITDRRQTARSTGRSTIASAGCTLETLSRATRKRTATSNDESCYSCQATELLRAAPERIPSWDGRQYIRDVKSGNVGGVAMLICLLIGAFNEAQDAARRLLPKRLWIRGGRRFPFIEGRLRKTPEANLRLRPGEVVRIKSKDEIVRTLDIQNRNRGISFDPEMVKYCGREARVRQRVEQIIDEKTGRMVHLKNSCIMLEDVVCSGAYHRYCPRKIYPYWREIWLERVAEPMSDHHAAPAVSVGVPRQTRIHRNSVSLTGP